MKYDFTTQVSRENTGSSKWDGMYAANPNVPEGTVPFSVADMEFKNPPQIAEDIGEYLKNSIMGYTFATDAYYDAVIGWMKRRHNWDIKKEWIVEYPGVVPALYHMVNLFTAPGDGVLLFTPVYYPFYNAVRKGGRTLAESRLLLTGDHYEIDFADFEEKAKDPKNKLLLLCSPHNPVGRVWTKEELSQIADICYENGTLVISDEIHADLTLPPYKHPTFALISEKARMNSLVFMSPSKAFNMPGLASSYAIIENDELRHQFQVYMEASEFSEGHLFAYLSVAAAYSHGTEWLDQVIAYIKGNIDFTESYLKERIPAIRMIRPQASYLIFLDCRELGLSQEELNRLFVEDAHLALNEGTTFGKEGEGFMRLNVACPRATLEKALRQLEQAVNNR